MRNKILQSFYFERYNFVSKLLSSNIVQNQVTHKKGLDLGCGAGNLLDILYKFGFESFGIDYSISVIKKIPKKHIVIRSYIPPLPFIDSCFDFVIALGLTEHISNEKVFIEDIIRVLKKNGIYICSIPIEIGYAGLIRHITKFFTYGVSHTLAKSFFDYSIEEFKGTCSREKHNLKHKYYNYKYLLTDLIELFSTVDLYYWPIFFPKRLAPIIFARCVKL